MSATRSTVAGDGPRSLRSGFLRWAAASPEAPALVVKDRTLAYGDLERIARTYAGAIIQTIGRPAERVGVFASRSETANAGVLAALCSGAAFVPLNPTFPAARTRAMIERAELDAVIVDRGAAKQLAEVLAGLDRVPPIIAPDADSPLADVKASIVDGSALHGISPLRELPPVSPSQIAYLLFTSGSTGVPKGVGVTHANALHFMDYVAARYQFVPSDRFSQTFDQTFDLSVFDQFAAWENGACLCAMQPLDLLAPVRFAERQRLTVWFSVPSIAALMRKKGTLKPNVFPTFRLSLFCGEPLPRSSAEAWQAAAPQSILENLYGPTELTIACLTHRWDPADSPQRSLNDIVPIGKPFDGLTAVAVDDALRPVTVGEPGELCVSGPQTVPGYWHDPAKTAEQFVTLTVGGVSDRYYRTGDRVQQLPDGDFVYLGRTDHQVKVLGHRVELAEVEAALGRNEGVTQAVALGWPMVDGSAEALVAFVTGAGIDPQRLTANVRRSLPDYMTPRTIHVLDSLPLNANGKVDRVALRRGLDSGAYVLASAME